MSDEAIKLDWHAVSSADAVERVARALCRHDGRNPDLSVSIVLFAGLFLREMRREGRLWRSISKSRCLETDVASAWTY